MNRLPPHTFARSRSEWAPLIVRDGRKNALREHRIKFHPRVELHFDRSRNPGTNSHPKPDCKSKTFALLYNDR
jgi:hypothetical protein